MSASAPFRAVVQMLEDCAKGSTLRLATHSRVVEYNGKVFRHLPKHDDIELGHIRKMVRFLQIDRDCVRRHIPNF
jgi:hypothetical protein